VIRSRHAFLAGVFALGLLTTSTARADRFSANGGGDMGDGTSGDYWANSGGYGFASPGEPGGSSWPCTTAGACDTWGAEIQFEYTAFLNTNIQFVDILMSTSGTPATPAAGSGNCDVTSGGTLAIGTHEADIMCSFNTPSLSGETSYYVFLQPSCGASGTNCLQNDTTDSPLETVIVGPLTSSSPVPEPASIVLGLSVMAMIALGRRKLLPRR
jgi:hypothetical protein